jgi:Rhodanese-like domain
MENRRTTFLALAAVILTLGALWYIHRPVIPQETALAEVQAEAARGGYRLITTEALAELYRQQPAQGLLVDTRQDWEYRSGHIQGAVNFPLGSDVAEAKLEALIRQHLGLPMPAPEKSGFWKRLFGK